MSITKFTKGEWLLRTQFQISIGEGFTTTQMTGDSFANVAEREANAHLIAAAPDMYNKLNELLTFLEVMHEADVSWTIKESIQFHREVTALLKSARGES